LTRERLAPQIVFGVLTTARGLEAHAWVEVDGEPIGEDPGVAERFTVLHHEVTPRVLDALD
jgi:hypothetical protein